MPKTPYSQLPEERKEHLRAYYRKWHKENRDKSNATRRKYNAKHRDRILAKRRADYNKDERYEKKLKDDFGMTMEDYTNMYEKQKGLCAICGTHQDFQEVRMAVDHNHKTEEIRGLLCRYCNSGLGLFKDNPSSLISAAEYLNPTIEYGLSGC